MAAVSTQSLKGHKPAAFLLDEMRVPVENWKGVLVGLCTHLYRKHGDDFSRKVLGLGGRKRTCFSRDPSDMREPKAIGESGIYVETNENADVIVRRCEQVLDVLGYAANSFEVEVAESGRPDVRRRRQTRGPVLPPPPAPTAASPISLTNLIAEHMRGLTNGLEHRIASLSAEQFEELVAIVLGQLGYSDVRRVGGPGDRNIDVIAAHRAPFIKVPIRVQVKHRRGTPNVGPTDVAAFRDRAGGADHVLLMVTKAQFTDGAKETASEAGRQVVHLIDGKDLINCMIDDGIGLRQGTIGIPETDEDFWREMQK